MQSARAREQQAFAEQGPLFAPPANLSALFTASGSGVALVPDTAAEQEPSSSSTAELKQLEAKYEHELQRRKQLEARLQELQQQQQPQQQQPQQQQPQQQQPQQQQPSLHAAPVLVVDGNSRAVATSAAITPLESEVLTSGEGDTVYAAAAAAAAAAPQLPVVIERRPHLTGGTLVQSTGLLSARVSVENLASPEQQQTQKPQAGDRQPHQQQEQQADDGQSEAMEELRQQLEQACEERDQLQEEVNGLAKEAGKYIDEVKTKEPRRSM